MATRTTSDVRAGPDLHRESIGDLLRELTSESAALVRGEIELAKQEIRENVAALGAGAAFLVGAALLGWIALLALCATVILALAPVLGGWLAGLVVTVALFAATAGVGFAGMRRLRRGIKPRMTIESLREDKEWLKRRKT